VADINHRLLRLAREARQLPQVELGVRTGIAQGTISKYEKGLINPSTEHLDALAAALQFPTSFFCQADVRPANVLYRSRSLRSAKAEAAVRARLNLARLVAIRVLEGIDVDTPARFPDPDVIFDSPSQAAAEMRRSWWLPPGPIDNVADAIEAAGGVVVPVDLGNDAVTAAYMQPMGDPVRWFFVNTSAAAGDRVRFALAHELGHAVVHTFDLLPENAEAEREAHEFAAAFHLPDNDLRAEFPRQRLQLSDLLDLKMQWGVSMQAIASRAQKLGLITKDDLTRLYKQISARGWRTREPGPVPLERGRVFSAALDVHRREHGLTDQELAALVHMDLGGLADLFPEHFSRQDRRLRVVSSR
jgi:Zn-dependent peptidase ImmA (M78 family)/transcriptional regulator with XRE-family HTH domain